MLPTAEAGIFGVRIDMRKVFFQEKGFLESAFRYSELQNVIFGIIDYFDA
jgi:hypothetical protein